MPQDGPVRLFNAESGEELIRLKRRGPVMAATFSPDGRDLAVGTAPRTLDGVKIDGEIQVWNLSPLLRPR